MDNERVVIICFAICFVVSTSWFGYNISLPENISDSIQKCVEVVKNDSGIIIETKVNNDCVITILGENK